MKYWIYIQNIVLEYIIILIGTVFDTDSAASHQWAFLEFWICESG